MIDSPQSYNRQPVTTKPTISLPWVRLHETLRPGQQILRVVINHLPLTGKKCLAQFFWGQSTHAADLNQLLTENRLSARQQICARLFLTLEPFGRQSAQFWLSDQQFAQLLPFANDVFIEVNGVGTLCEQPHPAQMTAQLSHEAEGPALTFHAVYDGKALEDVQIFGQFETLLVDKHLRIFRLEPRILPGEVIALLQSAPLEIGSLDDDEARQSLLSLHAMGINLECLRALAISPIEEPKITLRALLAPARGSGSIALRLHLVTQLGPSYNDEEIEIPSRGALPEVHPIANGAVELVARPTDNEERARQTLFELGATAASSHRGFMATGREALNLLAHLGGPQIPAFIHIDHDALPEMIRMPKAPKFGLVPQKPGLFDVLLAKLEIEGEHWQDIPIQTILDASAEQTYAITLPDQRLVVFSQEFAERLKLLADLFDLEKLGDEKKLGLTEAAFLARILAGEIELDCSETLRERLSSFMPELLPEDQQLPKALQTALRPYQHDAVAWLSQLHRANLGRLLADDMGLGKTLMVLSLVAKLKEKHGQKPSLVVAPTSVIDVWLDETKRHVPTLKAIKWHGPLRREQIGQLKDSDLVVTSYALLRMDQEFLSGQQFRYIILDEAQNVRNPRTESFKAARLIQSEQKLALSGTPIENRVEDLWSILELMNPGVLGTERGFMKRYAEPISRGDIARLEELKKRVRPLILRRKKEEVERELPPKIENILKCEMQADQKALYIQILQAAKNELADFLFGKNATQQMRMPVLAALTRLRQACCDPRLLPLPGVEELSSAKNDLFSDTLAECLALNRRIIIYSQFVKMQKLIHQTLQSHGVKDALWLHGATRNRREVVEQFQRPDGPKVIVVSLKAGGTGVTLTAADTVIFYDPWWNPAVEDQAADRAHRIGQTKTVHVIKLVCANSIEEQILELSQQKRALAQGVLTADQAGQRSLTMDEIRALLMREIETANL